MDSKHPPLSVFYFNTAGDLESDINISSESGGGQALHRTYLQWMFHWAFLNGRIATQDGVRPCNSTSEWILRHSCALLRFRTSIIDAHEVMRDVFRWLADHAMVRQSMIVWMVFRLSED